MENKYTESFKKLAENLQQVLVSYQKVREYSSPASRILPPPKEEEKETVRTMYDYLKNVLYYQEELLMTLEDESKKVEDKVPKELKEILANYKKFFENLKSCSQIILNDPSLSYYLPQKDIKKLQQYLSKIDERTKKLIDRFAEKNKSIELLR
jgi:gas vesicle protein